MDCENTKSQNCCTAIIFGILFGIAAALLWFFRLVTFIRYMIPYATALALLILLLGTILAVAFKCCGHGKCSCGRCTNICLVISLIAASIFIIFSLIFTGSVLTFTVKVILSFIGGLSFATMLSTFLITVIGIACKSN